MYLSNFPRISYDFTGKQDTTPIIENLTDLSTKITMSMSEMDFEVMCVRYLVQGNELPEHVSQKFYNTPDLAWTILYINGIGDLATDWPLSDVQLSKFITEKYGPTHINDVKFYIKTPERVVMDYDFIASTYGAQYASPITNSDYEIEQNEYKRRIYVVKPQNISLFVKQYKNKLV